MAWTPKSVVLVCVCALVRTQVIPGKSRTNDGDYNNVETDGSFDFGYANKDRGQSYHLAHGNAQGVVGGRFGARDPATDTVKETIYSAGPRGFRAKGPNIHRKIDLDQRPRGPIGNKDDPYFDPNEDPSYAFQFDTAKYTRNENADSRGDVKGHYSFVDDVGERHDVSYIAGRDTGFHVSSSHPDSPNVIGAPFHRSPLVRGETKPRGRTAIQRNLDGSYHFISAGPDQRRTESSDAQGYVKGSYTFLDDKGIQRTVNYIAGPKIGYRIVKNSNNPQISTFFPTISSVYEPDFISSGSTNYSPDDSGTDDVFKGPDGTAASGHVKPPPFPSNEDRPNKKPTPDSSAIDDLSGPDLSGPSGSGSGGSGFGGGSGGNYGGGSRPTNGPRPTIGTRPTLGTRPTTGTFDGGSGNDNDNSYGTGPISSNFPSTGSNNFGGTGNVPFGGRPSNKPSGGGSGNRPFGGRPGKKPLGNRPGSGTFTGGTGSGSSSGGNVANGDGNSGESGYQRPDFGQGIIDEDIGYVDEDAGFGGGNKPTKGPQGIPRPRPTSKPPSYRPPSKPSDKDEDGGYDGGTDDKNTPQFVIQFTKPGATIIKNIGRDYFGVLPGTSVRAHVQSIDLYPYDSEPISPSEAMQKDKT